MIEKYYNEVFKNKYPDMPPFDVLDDEFKKSLHNTLSFAFWNLGQSAAVMQQSMKDDIKKIKTCFSKVK